MIVALPDVPLTAEEVATAGANLCALLASNAGVLATLDDAAREWLHALIVQSVSTDVQN